MNGALIASHLLAISNPCSSFLLNNVKRILGYLIVTLLLASTLTQAGTVTYCYSPNGNMSTRCGSTPAEAVQAWIDVWTPNIAAGFQPCRSLLSWTITSCTIPAPITAANAGRGTCMTKLEISASSSAVPGCPNAPPITDPQGPNEYSRITPFQTAQQNLGPPKACGIGNPCNPANGNKYQTELDSDSSPSGLTFTRHYNSFLEQDIGIGVGWTTTFHKRIEPADSGNSFKIARQDNGRGENFNCGITPCSGLNDSTMTLVKDATGYTLTHRNGATERYDLNGKLSSEKPPRVVKRSTATIPVGV